MNNSLVLINKLYEVVDNKLYKQNSMRVLINLLWKEYKPQIVKFRLVPFLLYLFVQNFVTLSGSSMLDEI